jgi:thioredoxin-related protein
MDVKKIEPYLIYFTENVYRTTQFDKFKPYFDKTFVDSLKEDSKYSVKWLSFKKAQELNKKEPRPFYIDVYNIWTVSHKIMDTTTYRNKDVAEYINTHFYPVKFDMFTKDTINFFGKQYINENKQVAFHQFGLEYLNKRMISPSSLFLDKQGKLLSHVPGYFTPESLLPILIYFAEEKYKTQTWQQFATEYNNKDKQKDNSNTKQKPQ